MKKLLLDTDTVIYSFRGNVGVGAALAAADPAALITSTLVVSQLLQGICDAPDAALERRLISVFVGSVTVLPYDLDAASAYGGIVDAMGYSRRHAFDRMIAAHAISLDATLVTNNMADFAGIPDLKLVNWAQ